MNLGVENQKKQISLATGTTIIGCVAILAGLLVTYDKTENVVDAMNNSNVNQPTTVVYDQATISTSLGDIVVQLTPDKAPQTVANFEKLAKSGFYDGTKFHRVIKDFMIQAGDPNSKGSDPTQYGIGGPGYSFKDEINSQKLVQGVIAMANSGPNTNGSQFFIVTASATPWLDGHHTVFGKVIKGLDVVLEIGSTPTRAIQGVPDVPVEPVVVKSVKIK